MKVFEEYEEEDGLRDILMTLGIAFVFICGPVLLRTLAVGLVLWFTTATWLEYLVSLAVLCFLQEMILRAWKKRWDPIDLWPTLLQSAIACLGTLIVVGAPLLLLKSG